MGKGPSDSHMLVVEATRLSYVKFSPQASPRRDIRNSQFLGDLAKFTTEGQFFFLFWTSCSLDMDIRYWQKTRKLKNLTTTTLLAEL